MSRLRDLDRKGRVTAVLATMGQVVGRGSALAVIEQSGGDDPLVAVLYVPRAGLSIEQAIDYALHDTYPTTLTRDPDSVLTNREQQVAELVAQGLTNQQIAARLAISPRTVASHLEHIRTKLSLPTRAHVAAWVTRYQTSVTERRT